MKIKKPTKEDARGGWKIPTSLLTEIQSVINEQEGNPGYLWGVGWEEIESVVRALIDLDYMEMDEGDERHQD